MGRDVEDPNKLVEENKPHRRRIGSGRGNKEEPQKGETVLPDNAITEEEEKGETEGMQNAVTLPDENGITVKPQPPQTEETQPDETAQQENGKIEKPQNFETASPGNDKTASSESRITVKPESGVVGEPQNGKTVETQSEKELFDQKVTLYLSWRQLDKLDDMVSGYRRRERKRTDQNKLMRMMIDKFNLDDLLGDETK